MENDYIPDKTLDLHGTACPMNLVKTKVALASLQSGDLLEVILDDGPPHRNVPQAAKLEGHQLLGEKQLADGAWAVLIRKA